VGFGKFRFTEIFNRLIPVRLERITAEHHNAFTIFQNQNRRKQIGVGYFCFSTFNTRSIGSDKLVFGILFRTQTVNFDPVNGFGPQIIAKLADFGFRPIRSLRNCSKEVD